MSPPAMTAVPTNQSSSSATASVTSVAQTSSANSPSSSSSTSQRTSSNANHSNGGDSLFEPSVEMMVNDFDDERTLEEEEALALASDEDPSTELSNLQRERDMPIEELLALYRCPDRSDDDANEDTERPRSSSSCSPSNDLDESDGRNLDKDDIDEDEDESELRTLYPETFADDQRHLRTLSRPLSEEEDDGDYSPDEDDVKKTIMVGSEFQAVIPEGLCKYGDELPYENEDKLVWDPSKLKEKDVESFQKKSISIVSDPKAGSPEKVTSVTAIPIGNHLRDDEQMLYLLLQCGHNVDEALRRRRISAASGAATANVATNEMSEWSEEECRNFENGLRTFGKDFHIIQQLKVKTRSVGELVQFYYLWKKTERHDIFANKARLEKKKYSLHPGLTDYMDRFLEEQECTGSGGGGGGSNGNAGGGGLSINNGGQVGIRDRSSSPGVNSLMYNNYRKNNYRSGAPGTMTNVDTNVSDSGVISDNESTSPQSIKPKESNPSQLNTLNNSARL